MSSVGFQVLDQIANARCVDWVSGVEESIEDDASISISFHPFRFPSSILTIMSGAHILLGCTYDRIWSYTHRQ